MKKLTLGFCALVALGSAAFAGTEMTTDSKTTAVVPPPCPQWYADNEFNLTLSGIYAFSGNSNTFLDHGWGGSLEAKYFFKRYFGIGVQGFLLDADTDEDFRGITVGRRNDDGDGDGVGGLLGTFTVRFPGNCSRFAPYFWIGGGGVWGEENEDFALNAAGAVVRVRGDGNESHAMGQVGGGFEVRFTPHVGWQNDFSWNIVSGSNNNFGMYRTGINFAF
jgi:hypothetical protein